MDDYRVLNLVVFVLNDQILIQKNKDHDNFEKLLNNNEDVFKVKEWIKSNIEEFDIEYPIDNPIYYHMCVDGIRLVIARDYNNATQEEINNRIAIAKDKYKLLLKGE